MNNLMSFASDNNAGMHPRVLEALVHANRGMAPSYGADEYTAAFEEAVRAAFGPSARPWIVANGTAANVLALKSMLRSHEAVLCANSAHINTSECGAAEAIVGCKLLVAPSFQGKIKAEDCLPFLEQRENVHRAHPKVLSISQATEWGTVYTPEELANLGAFCREHGLYFHMDGARLANAAAALNLPLKAISVDAGVDVLSFGGTKNGLLAGEAIIFFNETLGREFGRIRKQHLQLLSKMRFMSAQFLAYLKDDLWLENARAANRMAALLAEELEGVEQVCFEYPVQTNVVFARLSKNAVAKLQERFYFLIRETSEAKGTLVRLMTAFTNTEEEVRGLADAIRDCKE